MVGVDIMFSIYKSFILTVIFHNLALSQNPHRDGDVRLVGGNATYKGRVEVSYGSLWGTICDDSWGLSDARVVCRQLNLPHRAAAAVTGAFFGEGSGPIWLDNVNCNHHEDSRINECEHHGWGNHNCKHSEDAGVICSETGLKDIRLVRSPNGMEYRGWVEVRYEGVWLAVCQYGDDEHHNKDHDWNNQVAFVACRQLGYPGGKAIFSNSNGISTRNRDLIVNDIRCTDGLHASLQECSYEIQESGCYADRQAGVTCFESGLSDVRLVGSPNGMEYRGWVEVLFKDVWLAVCFYGDHEYHTSDDDWNNEAANVVCHQLGYAGGEAMNYADLRGTWTGYHRAIINDVRCGDGSFNNLGQCSYEIQENDCHRDRLAGVFCFADATTPLIPLNMTSAGKYQETLTSSNEASEVLSFTLPIHISTTSKKEKDGNGFAELERGNTGAIAGVVGVLVLGVLVVVFALCICKRVKPDDSDKTKLEFDGPYDLTMYGTDHTYHQILPTSNEELNSGNIQNNQMFGQDGGDTYQSINEQSEDCSGPDTQEPSAPGDAETFMKTPGDRHHCKSSSTCPAEGWVDNTLYTMSDADNVHAFPATNTEQEGWVDNSIYGE